MINQTGSSSGKLDVNDVYLPDPGPGFKKTGVKVDTVGTFLTRTPISITAKPVSSLSSPLIPIELTTSEFSDSLLYNYPECNSSSLLPTDTLLCGKSELVLHLPDFTPASVCGLPATTVKWNNQLGTDSFLVNQSGSTTVEVAFGPCFYQDTISVTIDETKWSLKEKYEPCFLSEEKLEIKVDNSIHGKWEDAFEDSISITASAVFRFSGITHLGCPYKDSVEVDEKCDEMVYLPSTFTPDGDGINDVYAPVGAGLQTWSMTVYDRWGRPIWTGNESTGGWDGRGTTKEVNAGFYVFSVDYNTVNGEMHHQYGYLSVVK